MKGWYKLYGFVDEKGKPVANPGVNVTLKAMPLADIHLQSHAEKEFEPNGRWQVVYMFIAVAILIIIIATINYINLSNAIAIKRSKEVAIRKTIGATRQKLFLNFIAESYTFTLLACVLSIGLVVLLMPQFNLITGKQLYLETLLNFRFMSTLLMAWIVLRFLSGLYPATVLSSFNAIQALKSGISSGRTSKISLYLRRGLIISQFTISAFLIVSAFTIHQQMDFIGTRDTGFNRNNVVVVPLIDEARSKAETIKNEILKQENLESCAITSVVPGKRVVILNVRVPDLVGTQSGASTEESDNGERSMRVIAADHDFVKTLGLKIMDGRDFSIENAADANEAFLLNEAAVKHFNLKDPVGRLLNIRSANRPRRVKS